MKAEIAVSFILCECLSVMTQVKGIREKGVRHLTCPNKDCPHYGKIFKPPTVELEEVPSISVAGMTALITP